MTIRALIAAATLLALFVLAPTVPSADALFHASTSNPANALATLEVADPLSASGASLADGVVRLEWLESPTAGSETVTYLVLRRPGGSDEYAIVAAGIETLSHEDLPGEDGPYDYLVQAVVGPFRSAGAATSSLSDRTPPTAPGGLAGATGAASGSVVLSWTAATDAGSGVAGYTVRYRQENNCSAYDEATYIGVVDVGNVTSATVAGLSPNTRYCFRVLATDVAGNRSAPSDGVVVRAQR